MGYYLAFPILIIAVVLQTSFFPTFFVGAGQPELMLIIVLSWAVHAEWEEAIFWAFMGGLMQDLLAITPTGTSVIALLLMIFAIKQLSTNLYRFNIIFLIGFVIFGTVIHHIIVVLVLGLMGYVTDITEMVRWFTLPTVVYNVVGILPVYIVLRHIQKRIPKPQSAWAVSSHS